MEFAIWYFSQHAQILFDHGGAGMDRFVFFSQTNGLAFGSNLRYCWSIFAGLVDDIGNSGALCWLVFHLLKSQSLDGGGIESRMWWIPQCSLWRCWKNWFGTCCCFRLHDLIPPQTTGHTYVVYNVGGVQNCVSKIWQRTPACESFVTCSAQNLISKRDAWDVCDMKNFRSARL